MITDTDPDPDPNQNDMDPKHCNFQYYVFRMTNYEEPTKISYSQVAKKPAEPTSPESRGDTSPLSFNNIQKALKQPSAATKLSLDDVKVIIVTPPPPL